MQKKLAETINGETLGRTYLPIFDWKRKKKEDNETLPNILVVNFICYFSKINHCKIVVQFPDKTKT